jgi:hypothetical protein
MSYLLYCVFRSPVQQGLEIPLGVEGRPVSVVSRNGLSAGLSELTESGLVPDTAGILAYEKVVEAFFRHLTVIPMRYGCQFEDVCEAGDLLETHRDEYGALLDQLEGLGEMSIHVLIGNCGGGTESNAGLLPSECLPPACDSGAAYLAAKRQRYLGLDREALDQRLLVDELCGVLTGLFVRRKVEFPNTNRSRLLSLFFLVPRASIEAFRQAARDLHPREPVKLLLSGPWPPYNFVDCLEK